MVTSANISFDGWMLDEIDLRRGKMSRSRWIRTHLAKSMGYTSSEVAEKNAE